MVAPGVYVTTAVRSGPTGTPRVNSGQYFVIGLAERGPVDKSVKINSMSDYRREFGERVSYGALFDDLSMFFESGGKQAHVLRVVGAAATLGTITAPDTAAVDTIRFDASSAGAWSSAVDLVVSAGDNPGTVKIIVTLDGTVVEAYNNLPDVASVVSRTSNSLYFAAVDLGSVTAAPGNLPAVGTYSLSAGTDDRLTVDAARIGARLSFFNAGDGDGAVAAPGFGSSVHTVLVAHAKANRRIALLSVARGASIADLRAVGLGTDDGEYAGVFGPHLAVSDGFGGTRVVSPEGFAAAARAKAHDLFGPWTSPAGEESVSPYILGVDQEFSEADHELLEAARVSPVRIIANRVRLYGWRSLSADEPGYGSLAVQDTLNRLAIECEARLEPFVHKTIDGRGQLFAAMTGVLIGVVEPIRAAGGIYEMVDQATQQITDPGYSVDVGRSRNTLESLQGNRVNAQVAVRLSPNAQLINVAIIKVGLTSAV